MKRMLIVSTLLTAYLLGSGAMADAHVTTLAAATPRMAGEMLAAAPATVNDVCTAFKPHTASLDAASLQQLDVFCKLNGAKVLTKPHCDQLTRFVTRVPQLVTIVARYRSQLS